VSTQAGSDIAGHDEIWRFVQGSRPVETILFVETQLLCPNSSHRHTTISFRYRLGFRRRYSSKASRITEITDGGRSPPFGGAVVLPKSRRFRFIALTAGMLQ
jgi:hypothetical protein